MDSLGKTEVEDFDVDQALSEWLSKEAAAAGLDPDDPYGGELEMIKRFQQDPTPENFNTIFNSHKKLVYAAGRRYLQSSNLPKAAIESSMMKSYINALNSYNPDRGAQFKTYLSMGMGRTGRYVQKYSNAGRIPEGRSWLIDTMMSRERALEDELGRPPSDAELGDDVLLAIQDIEHLRDRKVTPKMVATLRKEVRKDYLAEAPGGEAVYSEDSKMRRQATYLHGSLNPQQQLVLEHTIEGFGKQTIPDAMDLARKLKWSPQKIRSLRKQIGDKLKNTPEWKKVSR